MGVIFRMSQHVDISNARSQTVYNIHKERDMLGQQSTTKCIKTEKAILFVDLIHLVSGFS